jgi:predicted ATPase
MLLAEACGQMSKLETGLEWIDFAATHARTFSEAIFEAEIHRIYGELLLKASAEKDAEAHLQRATDIARAQKGKSPELRAAMALARLRGRQGRRQEAHDLVAPIHGWFTEGFNTPDLRDARALLDQPE